MGGELIRSLDDGVQVLVVFQDIAFVAPPQLRGEHIHQTLPGHLLDGRTLPPGIVTPLVGVPVVMVLLLSQRQRMQ